MFTLDNAPYPAEPPKVACDLVRDAVTPDNVRSRHNLLGKTGKVDSLLGCLDLG